MSITAMKQALEALETDVCKENAINNAAFFIKQAIEQAQEPVAWMHPGGEGYGPDFRNHSTVMACTGNKWEGWIPLYTTPLNPLDSIKSSKTLDAQPQREWVGLTDEETQQAFVSNSVMVDNGNAYMVADLRAINIGRAIETKLKEKNT